MGLYVNPPNMTKEDWLIINGKHIKQPSVHYDDGKLAVCLMNNGAFTAAGVCISDDELKVFTDPSDKRLKLWFSVEVDKLEEIMEVREYIR